MIIHVTSGNPWDAIFSLSDVFFQTGDGGGRQFLKPEGENGSMQFCCRSKKSDQTKVFFLI
jgi:hypothetical protein